MKEEHLDRYARILVEHAVGLRQGQRLDVYGELIHREFGLRVGEAAYAAGAGRVRYRLTDPQETAQLIRHGSPEQIVLKVLEIRRWLDELLSARGALLVLDGRSDPDLLPGLARSHPRNHRLFARESSLVSLDFTRRVVDQRLAPSSLAVCPTPGAPGLPQPRRSRGLRPPLGPCRPLHLRRPKRRPRPCRGGGAAA